MFLGHSLLVVDVKFKLKLKFFSLAYKGPKLELLILFLVARKIHVLR